MQRYANFVKSPCICVVLWILPRFRMGVPRDVIPCRGNACVVFWCNGVWDYRVAVGATGRSPATQAMRKHRISPPWDAATYTSSADATQTKRKHRISPPGDAATDTSSADVTRASFHSPLHCLYGQSLIMPCRSPRRPPRSCRGDWKVARNTNHAKTRSIPAR